MSNGLMLISTATQRNWGKLSTDCSERLKRRANKSRSEKMIIPDNYISSEGLDFIATQLRSCKASNEDIFYSLCLKKLSYLGNNANVKRFIAEYKRSVCVDISVPEDLLYDTKRDWLGFLYQMRIPEGQRNIQGQYYTNFGIVSHMLSGISLRNRKTLLDPCCGTGAFLMNTDAESLSQLYGVDIDEIAVMIAKANLIALYPTDITYPQIYCDDFLEESVFSAGVLSYGRFDFIYTNPPWGICKNHQYYSDVISSSERSSLFFVKAFGQLKPGGRLCFLLPSSLLKIKTHQDLRSFILRNTTMIDISLYNERFNGVFTDFFSITVSSQTPSDTQSYLVNKADKVIVVTKKVSDEDTEIELNCSEEQEILAMVESLGFDNLGKSVWALGVVTGDNKNKLKKEQEEGCEIIYTGKDIGRYSLKAPSHYIHYDRSQLQQCAKDEYYRCPEKLVYKFISKSLCFAYDNSSSLFLNSANLLIPNIKGMSIKTVLAFLNSELFSYYYTKKYADIKILKGNLMTIPFPQITSQQDNELSGMVDQILQGEESYIERINEYIYSLYGFPSDIVDKVKKELYGNIDFSA